ncbi:MAG: RelA/SpoT family protein [Patescibacteria group bacterium]
MEITRLLRTIKTHHPQADLDLVRLAYDFAEEAHRGQKRLSGEDYVTHSLATAQTLAEMKFSAAIVIAGLLHDVPEDTSVTLEDIKKNFGSDIAGMIQGVTKLGKIKYRGLERYIENLRKMFLAMAEDVRVVFIKFADRLHNLETLDALPPQKRLRVALESLEIYAAIANRLGMGDIKGRIEDLSFKYVYPEEYAWVTGLVRERYVEKERYLRRTGKIVERELSAAGITPISVYGRTKHLYSLYKKLLRYDRDIARIYDLVALRIIVKNVADCYAALGIIHARWKPLKGRIKDYIAQPKPNGYQSLHTTIFCEGGEVVEIQIRTERMHEESEMGVAAHWTYDEGGKGSAQPPQNLRWAQELLKIQKELGKSDDALESLQELKIDVFQNRIFAFTPKGDVIDLPEDSTPVDFAYAIHSDIGDSCVGSRVNDQLVPLSTPLRSGDVVQIITDKNRRAPSQDWLAFVKTQGARSKIKARVRKARRG